MQSKNIKLFGYATSPFVRKTACFLYYKNLPFEHIPVNPLDPEATLAHTDGTQVPVLQIDDEWRLESSAHALWLDELFAHKPLCPAEHSEKVLVIDQWLNQSFFPSIFRGAIDGDLTLDAKFRYWRLASLVSAHTPLPEEIRHQWPDLVSAAPFICAMGDTMDLSESAADMQYRIAGELVAHIGEGPYIGSMEVPTMLDLAVFPQLVFGYMFGLEEQLGAAQHPVLKAWMINVASHLPANPTLAAEALLVNTLTNALS